MFCYVIESIAYLIEGFIMTNDFSLASNERIQILLDEANSELTTLQPEIEYLENCVIKLNELKQKKNKLLSLKASLITLLNLQSSTFTNKTNYPFDINTIPNSNVKSLNTNRNETIKNTQNNLNTFVPEVALDQVKQFLRIKNNLNYELFKAVVFNGGNATTEEIKQYLVTNKIKQPKTGRSFEDVELKDISSRVNYLVRKKLLITIGPGNFRATLGFINNNDYSQ